MLYYVKVGNKKGLHASKGSHYRRQYESLHGDHENTKICVSEETWKLNKFPATKQKYKSTQLTKLEDHASIPTRSYTSRTEFRRRQSDCRTAYSQKRTRCKVTQCIHQHTNFRQDTWMFYRDTLPQKRAPLRSRNNQDGQLEEMNHPHMRLYGDIQSSKCLGGRARIQGHIHKWNLTRIVDN